MIRNKFKFKIDRINLNKYILSNIKLNNEIIFILNNTEFNNT